jgi:hypothetical protein
MKRMAGSSGRLRDLLAAIPGPLKKPILRAGDVLVADPFAHALIRINPSSGAQSVIFRDPTFMMWSLAVSRSRVLVGGSDLADGLAKVVTITPGSATRRTVATFGRPGDALVPHGIAFASNGDLFVTVTGIGGVQDDSIVRVSARRRPLDPGQPPSITIVSRRMTIPLVADGEDRLYICTRLAGDKPAILRIDAATGNETILARGVPAMGLALAGRELYATTWERGSRPSRVVRIDARGQVETVASGSPGGLLRKPVGIALTRTGALVVVNYFGATGLTVHGDVVKVSLRSQSQTLLASGGALDQPWAVGVVPD